MERNNSIKIKSLMFWALGKYLLKHVVFKWQKMSYHLYTSEFPSSWSDVADQTSRPGLSSARADRFPYGRPLLVGWVNGLSGFRLLPIIPLLLSLSTFRLFLHLTILPPPPPQMCLFMCRAKWSDREKHLRGKKTLIRCDYLWSSINIPFGWKDSTRLNVLALIASQYYLSTHKMDKLEVSFFSFKGLIIRDFNFSNYVS